MRTRHLSDIEIQQYAFNESDCEPAIIEHIEKCKECRMGAATYRSLFSQIKEQPKPAFDFDLPGLVLARLPRPKRRFSWNGFFVLLLGFVVILITGVTVFMFRIYLSNLFAGVSTFFMYTIMAAAILTVIFKAFAMYKEYQKQTNDLDFS